MRIRLLNVVLLAALFFFVSRLWLFLGEPPPALPPIKTVALPPAATESEQPADVAELRPEAYEVIVARDLFSPARGVVPPTPAAAARAAPKPLPPPKLTLSGVVIIDGEKSAYLQEGTQEGRPRKVREQENFAGGVVKTIRPDGITFLFAGSEITVPLRLPRDGGGLSPRGQDTVTPAPRSPAPAVFPRRQQTPAVSRGQTLTPGGPMNAPAIRSTAPPADTGGDDFEEEEFPDESTSGDDESVLTDEESGD